MNQIMCYNDCLYSYREAAEFMIFSDMDDLIMPENGDLLSKASLLETFLQWRPVLNLYGRQVILGWHHRSTSSRFHSSSKA
ncbi:unnamed protein product [Bursaphelenchus xylophilus]|uniref:Glycosyltransferase family 92 protein n=1 Tax=Bursaphelenchus xylophilus TaxID=6326 RepID=A0A811KAG6_BURXY|nr:unnamed protein product [Bursaphelenchus xylophilus]CAG9091981.1 unnamed protein product [Bursaphelenchus xylophilus]